MRVACGETELELILKWEEKCEAKRKRTKGKAAETERGLKGRATRGIIALSCNLQSRQR